MMRPVERTPLLGRKRTRRRSGMRSFRDNDDSEYPSNDLEPLNRGNRATTADFTRRNDDGLPVDHGHDVIDEYYDNIETEDAHLFATPPSQGRRRNNRIAADGYSGGVDTFEHLAPDNVSHHPPRHASSSQQKNDRRSFSQRLYTWVRQKIYMPTLGYRNVDQSNGNRPTAVDAHSGMDQLPDCTCHWGTSLADEQGTWINTSDHAGTVMALLVWVLIVYCAGTMIVLARHGHAAPPTAALQVTLSALVWASHAKTMLTDPGTVPRTAVPLVTTGVKYHTMCSVCQSYKPRMTHHCRICNRCISRMDHHCPWMNNCVGAGNLKHFILFLVYAWLGSAFALSVFGWNYFFCRDEECEFHGVEIQLVRAMSCICLGTFLFTSSMMMNVIYGIITGTGTIDRLKLKADATWHLSDEDATPLTHIFGTGPLIGWFFPVDPVWEDFGKLMGYGTVDQQSEEADFA